MKQYIQSEHHNDDNGNPAGGHTWGTGIEIDWQDGPLAVEPNGAFVEGVIAAAIDRLEYYQGSQFASNYNAIAITYLNDALAELQARTADREARGVEGTHTV